LAEITVIPTLLIESGLIKYGPIAVNITSGQSIFDKKAASPQHADGSLVFARWDQ